MNLLLPRRKMLFTDPVRSALSFSGHAGVIMSGDPGFDSDSISNAKTGQWRWLSHPGGRLSLNPAPGKEISPDASWDIPPLGEKLPLDIGAFFGTKAVRLMNLVTVSMSAPEGVPEFSTSRSTAWFPYKLVFDADFSEGAKVRGTDFFNEAKDAIVRELEMEGAKGKVLHLAGSAPASTTLHWDADRNTLCVKHPDYACEIRLFRLEGAARIFVPLSQPVKTVTDGWSLELPIGSNSEAIAVVVGFASGAEGAAKASARVAPVISEPVSDLLDGSKIVMDDYLRKVPAPQKWGVKDASGEISANEHRRAYYASWAFTYQDLIDVYPESREYPFPQFSVGKPSLWDEGEKTAPASCAWESLFAFQWNSFVDPELSWKAYLGLMSRVDNEGVLGGESLPSRKAQTAWILHRNKPDPERLRSVYPALKRYLLWREKNPRWVYSSNMAKDEKDIEFAVSWLVDTDYAILISNELGMANEATLWEKMQTEMIGNMRKWFFSDPEQIQQFYFADTGTHASKTRFENVSMMITSALCRTDLPKDLRDRTEQFFFSKFDASKPLCGFEIGKHPDLNLTAYGLIDQGIPEAKAFIETFLASAIRAGEFSEELNIKSPALVHGVKPSLFSPINIIEFTWLLNGVRYESGVPTAFDFPTPTRPHAGNHPQTQAQR